VWTVVAPAMGVVAVEVVDAAVAAVVVTGVVWVVAVVTTGVLLDEPVDGLVVVTVVALTVDASPNAAHTSVAPLLPASPL
jgi:hypothetical protein